MSQYEIEIGVTSRQHHYVEAESEEEAINKVKERSLDECNFGYGKSIDIEIFSVERAEK
jgi:hypothetical protein